MSTSVAISGAMAGVAAMEAERAAEEHRQACLAFMPTFSDANASIETKRSYAGCVETAYPNPINEHDLHAIQVIVVLVLSAFVIGAIHVAGDKYADLLDRVMYGLVYSLGAIAFLVVGWGLWLLFT